MSCKESQYLAFVVALHLLALFPHSSASISCLTAIVVHTDVIRARLQSVKVNYLSLSFPSTCLIHLKFVSGSCPRMVEFVVLASLYN